jgi:hypothetical protein
MSEEKFIGEATPDQIKEWKEKYGVVNAVKVDGHICYLKNPSRSHLSAASVAAKTDPLKFNEVILRNCWLGGSEEIRTNDALFLGASGVLDQLIEIKEAELEKL